LKIANIRDYIPHICFKMRRREHNPMLRFLSVVFVFLIASICFAEVQTKSIRVRNLTAFTKLWGYVKHFYPSDEAQDIDWDSFAIYGSEQVITAKNDYELSKILMELFQPIVPDIVLYSNTKPKMRLDSLLPGRRTTFWQYEGYNNTTEASSYRSIRTNRPIKIGRSKQNSFIWASLSPQLPDSVGPDDKLRVTLKIFSSGSESRSTELRIGFGGDYLNETLSTGDWLEKTYVLEGRKEQQEPLWLAFIGLDSLYVESFRVENWRGGEWHNVLYSNFGEDIVGSLPSDFNINLSPLSTVASSDVDILVRSLMGKKSLAIQKAGPEKSYTLGIIDKIFTEELPYGELLDKQLVPGLYCCFPMVLQCDMEHTYPIADTVKLDNLKQQYSVADLHDRTDPGVWLAGVIRYWNELNFFYPYFEYNICDWEKELPLCLDKVLQSKDFLEYKQALRLLMSKTQDGHAFLSDQSHNSKMPKFTTYPVDGKWIVTSMQEEILGIRYTDEVIKMNGKDFGKLMQDSRPYFISANPETTDIRLFSQYMKTYQDSVATFTFVSTIDDNKYEYTMELPLEEYTGWKWVVKEDKIAHYDGGIIYLNLNTISEVELQEAMPYLLEAKGIILDLRYYPKISRDLLSNLLSKPDSLAITLVKRYMRPHDELPRLKEDRLTWSLLPSEPHIGAKIVALSSRNSQSYCEAFLAILRHNKLATIVGQPSAGANGDVIISPLPGDIKVYWTGMLVRNPDKSRFFGVGIIPDVMVTKTIDDIKFGRDPEREKALEILMTSVD
jgi:hypothetical protein